MLSMTSLAWLVSITCVLGLLWAETSGPRQLSWLFKPLAAACFIWLAVLQGATDSAYGLWLLAGLCLCMVGDVLLIPEGDPTFKAGLASFLLGHVLYAVAFLQLPSSGLAGGAALVPIVLLAFLSLRWLRPHLPADMSVPVHAYILVICLMLLAASSNQATLWIIAGAWGFAFSDLAVARQQFVNAEALNRLWGTPLYFGSQMVLAMSPAMI
jgi:uncharacterized membrane protein YhhN